MLLGVRRTTNMQIRTQVFCFVTFLAILLTGSLVHSQVQGVRSLVAQIPAAAAAPMTKDPAPFYADVAERFHVAADDVRAIAARGLPPGQVPVVYFIAKHSLRQPREIVADREAGKSWRDIAVASGLQPEQFYYPLPGVPRAPFVNVYALFHQVPRDRWSWQDLALTDADLENLVDLQLLAHDGGSAGDVLRLRADGLDYVTISTMLLKGQKTAERAPAAKAEGAVRS
jgi:hypothetical protein